jgi:site-specific recombinase XerC
VLISEAVAAYVADRAGRGEISALTAGHLRSRLGMLVEACPNDLDIGALDRDRVRAWQITVGALGPASRRAYLSTVRTFCAWCTQEGFMAGDPTAGLARVREPRRAPRALSAGQVARLRLVLPDLRAEVIVALMLGCGLRCVEVSRLSLGDYDPDGRIIFVVGKRGDERLLPVPRWVAASVDTWAAYRRAGPLIGLSPGALSRHVSAWMADAGIKTGPRDGISAHALRHTCASDMLDRCGNVRTVQEALGHASLATTQRYLRRASLDQLRAAMEPTASRPVS